MPEVPAAGFASPSHDFLDLLKAVKARKVKNEEKYAKRKKMRAMTYCLAEAIRRMKLPILVKAKQAALMHDGADDKLYCRFTVCTPEHTRLTGFLGADNTVQKHHTADSLALANSLKSITEGAFTQWKGVPFKTEEWRNAHVRVDTEAYDTFRKAVSQLNADEAKDEERARELTTDEWDPKLVREFADLKLDEINKTFPNGSLHTVDKPHSGKRLVGRLFNGIPILKEVHEFMVKGKHSIGMLVTNSGQFQESYAEHNEAEEVWRNRDCNKDLGMSTYKFASISEPLIKASCTMHSMCAMAQSIWTTRAGSKEAAIAVEWAEWLEMEHCILLGFMADAGAECVKLVRTWEPEDSEISEYMENVYALVAKAIVLFRQGEARHYGWGAKLIDKLKLKDIIFHFPCGKVKVVPSSDVTEECITKCLKVMDHWVDLLTLALRAENCPWELLQGFQCLSLSNTGNHIRQDDEKGLRYVLDTPDDVPLYTKMIGKLADLVKCEPGRLRKQIEFVKPHAQKLLDMKVCSSAREAWGQAVQQRLQWAKRRRIVDDKDEDLVEFAELAALDEYHQAWGLSTCGTERTIGIYRHTFGRYRKSSNIQRMNDELDIILNDFDETEVANAAALLYLEAYGVQRNRTKLRCDMASQRARRLEAKTGPLGKKEARRLRDADVAAAVKKAGDSVNLTYICTELNKDGIADEEVLVKMGSKKEERFLIGKFSAKYRREYRKHLKR